MLRTILSAAALSLVLSAGAEAAPRPPQAIWDAAAANLDQQANGPNYEADLEERAPTWMVTPKLAMFSRVDVNGDGIPDWRVDYEKAPNPSYFCGTGGCRQEVWVSEPGNSWARVMSVGVRQFKLSRRAGVTRLDLDFHGSTCDGYGAQACPRSYLWNERAKAFVETPTPDGRTWLSGGPVTLEPPNLDVEAPLALMAAMERMQMQCAVNYGTFEAGNVTRIPDLDGDGVRDWAVGGPYAACEYAMEDAANVSPKLPILFVVSAGGGDGALALEAPAGSSFGVDMKGAPATLWVAEPESACEFEKPCGKALRWDAAAGRLTQ